MIEPNEYTSGYFYDTKIWWPHLSLHLQNAITKHLECECLKAYEKSVNI